MLFPLTVTGHCGGRVTQPLASETLGKFWWGLMGTVFLQDTRGEQHHSHNFSYL